MPINVYRKYKEVIGDSQGPSLLGTNRERYLEIPIRKTGQEEQREDQEDGDKLINMKKQKEDLLIRAKGCSLYVKDGVSESTLRTVLKVVREDA